MKTSSWWGHLHVRERADGHLPVNASAAAADRP
jgi:hypothetical protein